MWEWAQLGRFISGGGDLSRTEFGRGCPHVSSMYSMSHVRDWIRYIREGSSGGEEEWGGVRSGPGEARTILLLHIISVRPLNSLLWYVPSSRDIWSSGPILFLQEQINFEDIFITRPGMRLRSASERQSTSCTACIVGVVRKCNLCHELRLDRRTSG